MPDIKAEITINAFREYFCTWGIPRIIVSDNGPTFSSEKFQYFLKNNCISQVLTAPYHPASNGAAENAVRHFKNKFKLLKLKMSRREAIAKYLFAIRSAVHSTTGVTPAELQIGHMFRTRLDAMKPGIRDTVERKQEEQRFYFRGNRSINFEPNQRVNVKDYSSNQWTKASVESKCSPVTYIVRTDDNRVWKRHADQMKAQFKAGGELGDVCPTPCEEQRNALQDAGVAKDTNEEMTTDAGRQNVVTERATTPRRSARLSKPRKILDL